MTKQNKYKEETRRNIYPKETIREFLRIAVPKSRDEIHDFVKKEIMETRNFVNKIIEEQ